MAGSVKVGGFLGLGLRAVKEQLMLVTVVFLDGTGSEGTILLGLLDTTYPKNYVGGSGS